MSAPDASLVPEVIAAYESVTINIEFALAVTAILLYDTILTLDKEIQNIWRSPRRWHQRALYIINRYAVLVGHILELGTTHPIANRSCVALAWIFNVAAFMSYLGPTVFTLMRTYALLAVPLDAESSSRRNIALGVVMLVLCTTTTIDNGITIFWQMPIDLPPPYNCSLTTSMSSSVTTTVYILEMACTTIGLLVAAAVTWRRTWWSWRQRSEIEIPSRRQTLPNVMFQYGMIYFGTMLLLIITTDTLWLLSITNSSVNSLAGYLQGFAITLPNILTSRFMLDIWETNAKIERGGATNTGSFSLDLDRAGTSDGPAGHCGDTIRTLEFVHSYGGPAPSYLTDDENEDEGDAQGESEDMNANANATATDEEARSYHPEAGVALSGMASGSGSAHETIIAWNAQR